MIFTDLITRAYFVIIHSIQTVQSHRCVCLYVSLLSCVSTRFSIGKFWLVRDFGVASKAVVIVVLFLSPDGRRRSCGIIWNVARCDAENGDDHDVAVVEVMASAAAVVANDGAVNRVCKLNVLTEWRALQCYTTWLYIIWLNWILFCELHIALQSSPWIFSKSWISLVRTYLHIKYDTMTYASLYLRYYYVVPLIVM